MTYPHAVVVALGGQGVPHSQGLVTIFTVVEGWSPFFFLLGTEWMKGGYDAGSPDLDEDG